MGSIAVMPALFLSTLGGINGGTMHYPTEQLFETWGYVIQSNSSAEIAYTLDESLPPQGGGPELVGWNWDVPIKASSFDGVRWTDDVVHLIGHWDGVAFTLVEFDTTSPTSPPLHHEARTADCEEAESLEVFNSIFSQWEEASRSESNSGIVSISPLDRGGYCGVLVTAVADSDELRQFIEPYSDAEVALQFLINPVDSGAIGTGTTAGRAGTTRQASRRGGRPNSAKRSG